QRSGDIGACAGRLTSANGKTRHRILAGGQLGLLGQMAKPTQPGWLRFFWIKNKIGQRERTVMQRFVVSWLTMALMAAVALPSARADDFPSQSIRLIIGFPPGSAADITARIVGDAMRKTLGQQMIVEARTGAGSSLAAEFVARAPADGYT